MSRHMCVMVIRLFLLVLAAATPAMAQQTGTITGTVTALPLTSLRRHRELRRSGRPRCGHARRRHRGSHRRPPSRR